MYIMKKHGLQIVCSIFILLLLGGTVTTIKLLSAHADANTVVPIDHGGTKVTARTTNYSGDDTNPPNDVIDWGVSSGYPTVHDTVGGTGTFANPITVAINSKNSATGDVPDGPYQIGEKFYIPRLHLYFVAEDSCNIDIAYNICTNNGSDQDNATQLHMDLFNGDSNDRAGLLKCELSYGDNTEVIANAGDGYPMPDQYPNGTSLFDAAGNCAGLALWNQYSAWTVGDTTTGSPQIVSSPDTTTLLPGTTDTSTAGIDDSVQGTGLNQFNYVGSGWQHCLNCDTKNNGFYNKSNSWDTTVGDYVTIAFTGTQINFYGVTGPHHGIGSFSIDGGTETPVDFYATTEAGNTLLYTSPTLIAGTHTLKITVTGQHNSNTAFSYVNPDRVQIISSTSTTTSIDDSVQGTGSNQFNYVGPGWHHCLDCDTASNGFYNKSNSWDSTQGDYVTIAFTGTQIKFYGVIGTHHGIGSFSIDGGTETPVDFYATTEAGNTLLYTSPALTAGPHTLKIMVTGQQNSSAASSHVNPDRVEITSDTTSVNSSDPLTNFATQAGKDASDPTASDSNWTNVWKDDFTAGAVDTTKWTIRDYAAGFVNNEQECYKNDGTHTRIDGSGASSHLVLQADQQTGNSACPYISGRLDTQGKYAVQPPTSGKPVRVEASLQLPAGGNGTWPAFWMLGQNITTAGWPNSGEIDIMENSGLRNMSLATTQATVHGLNNNSDSGRYTLSSGTLSDGYHILAMDWYTDHIVFSVDGNAYKTVDTSQLGGNQVFNQPFYILLNFAVGGDWPGNVDSSTSFPQQMNVNFVRVYQHN